jgi:hypothetical protein
VASSRNDAERDDKLRSLTAMLVLTVVLLGFMLMLMVLSLRVARRHMFGRSEKRAGPESLEDLWLKFRSEDLPDVDIEKLMSKDKPDATPPDTESPTT